MALGKYPSGEWTTVSISELCRRDIAKSAVDSLFSPSLTKLTPDFMDRFWDFDKHVLIGAYHAIIQFHPRSGALCLRSQYAKSIVYVNRDPTNDLTLARLPKGLAIKGLINDIYVLFRQTNHLRFGDYAFVVDFDLRRANQETFQIKQDLVLIREFSIRPSRHLDLIPKEHHNIAYNVCIHRRLSQSPNRQRSIFSGVRLHTSDPVAVKAMRCGDKKTRARIRSNLYINNIFRDHDGASGLFGLFDSWCPHGSPPCWVDRTDPDDSEDDVPDDDTSDDDTSDDDTPDDDIATFEATELAASRHDFGRYRSPQDEKFEGVAVGRENSKASDNDGSDNDLGTHASDDEFLAMTLPETRLLMAKPLTIAFLPVSLAMMLMKVTTTTSIEKIGGNCPTRPAPSCTTQLRSLNIALPTCPGIPSKIVTGSFSSVRHFWVFGLCTRVALSTAVYLLKLWRFNLVKQRRTYRQFSRIPNRHYELRST